MPYTTLFRSELTVFSHSPKGDLIGHAFIGITENGTTRYIGQWPDPGFEARDLPAILVSDMQGALDHNDIKYLNDPDTVSKTYALDDAQMKKLNDYISDFDAKNGNGKGYNLRNRQCANFAYGAARAAGVNDIKMPWYKWVTPASLSKKIKSLKCCP